MFYRNHDLALLYVPKLLEKDKVSDFSIFILALHLNIPLFQHFIRSEFVGKAHLVREFVLSTNFKIF